MQTYRFEFSLNFSAQIPPRPKAFHLTEEPSKLSFPVIARDLAAQWCAKLLETPGKLSDTTIQRVTTGGPALRRSTSEGTVSDRDLFEVHGTATPITKDTASDSVSMALELRIGLNPALAMDLIHQRYRALASENARRLLHDLSQPVQAIYSFGTSLQNSVMAGKITLPPKQEQWVKTASEQTERLVNLIKEHRKAYLSPAPHTFRTSPCLAMTLAVSEAHGSDLKTTTWNVSRPPAYRPAKEAGGIQVDLSKLLTCVTIYLSLCEAHGAVAFQRAEFGFLDLPKGSKDRSTLSDPGERIFFGFTLPFGEDVLAKWKQAAFDPDLPDLGVGLPTMIRILEELGPVIPLAQNQEDVGAPVTFGVLLPR